MNTKKIIGLVDADLLDNGTRHPNLALLKLAGYFKDHGQEFELIWGNDVELDRYSRIYLSRVFSFTNLPDFYNNCPENKREDLFRIGGTGWYMGGNEKEDWPDQRRDDLHRLEKDEDLPGLCMQTQMPDYDLYKDYVESQIEKGFKRDKYKDYLDYSIGFLTRGCFRHCPFCVNRLESKSVPHSKLKDFYNPEKPYIYLWDDNFFASKKEVWKPALEELMAIGKPFQFRQGLDERMIAQSKDGEEMAQMLAKSKYHGDFIFAFDNWSDRPIIEKALKIWKRYNPKKGTKFYLFCGFKQSKTDQELFYKDIWELFQRIKVLMQYRCVGYVMRHEDYHQAPIANFYVQVARWCNQQAFYKKMSFWEFCYRNQTYWEEKYGFEVYSKFKTYEDFLRDFDSGLYDKVGKSGKKRKICKPLQTLLDILELYPEYKEELLEMFNYKMSNLVNPHLWEE